MGDSQSSSSRIICNKPDSLSCGRHEGARYRSKKCQAADHSAHKLLCATFSGFNIISRSTEDHFGVILFPVDQKERTIVWLRFDGDLRDDEPFIGDDRHTEYIDYNPVLKRVMSDNVRACWRDSFLNDGSAPNNSIAVIHFGAFVA
ncbi:hypothetical protein F5X98DRAFT_380372 [Xylaria grammica]|nr:hypothetical protein F5X98DRAFT_380372 [Xylaria grammica]